MFDLKVINSVLGELEEVRGIPRASIIEAIEAALATAYKKEYGKKGQIIRTTFDADTGETNFFQVKIVVDDSRVIFDESEELKEEDARVIYNSEHHILIDDARKIKRDAQLDEEIIFPIESKGDYGRIAAQTAKQVITQKIREAEKIHLVTEFGKHEGEIVSGTVQRVERGNIFVDLGNAPGLLPYEEQIPGERFNQGERVRAYLYKVEESPRGVFLRLSRSHPKFLEKLFEAETPELANGTVVVKAVAREAGYRSKIAAQALDNHIDPVGALVGQRGVRVSTVMSELRGEKIDIIEWSAEPIKFIEEALSPAKILNIQTNEEEKSAVVNVSEDQQSLAIGKGGQNVRLAAKLTGWRIDIQSAKGEELAVAEVPVDNKTI
ncbi:MAG: transcription termination/antitermination protein NusA [Candidatus Zambryskibacteria bacterium CG_4_9_14_3_um_filter_42_15]|uniref:Transcription termination/antitermination protein NusA n=1 Tax=Candidatus Zambryskibacteria bacterium CG_4_9_14_3_um_filter_42_15 TaxID=1975112 RepID=A0A2M7WRJ9_9BACT|nr:MAG: transcription termination/antitermination protein NusA [Candidatus Zambryskibacteria bacterium CG_4_9_14_3_um_filter_42_15]